MVGYPVPRTGGASYPSLPGAPSADVEDADQSALYGRAPEVVGQWDGAEWTEFMYWSYLPVRMKNCDDIRIPDSLRLALPIERLVALVLEDARQAAEHLDDPYVYVTARRSWASPDNPVNRPGWHCDDFGGNNLNYVWSDRFPTRFAVQSFTGVSSDHLNANDQFERQVDAAAVHTYADGSLLRLDPFVVHNTPAIDPPGGLRSFLKISVSNHQFNLVGNSHNHLFDYAWRMWPREVTRNDPRYANADYGPQ